jgi:hypothetical protein
MQMASPRGRQGSIRISAAWIGPANERVYSNVDRALLSRSPVYGLDL